MDPKANLKEQRELSQKIMHDWLAEDGNGIDQDEAFRLASLMLALDQWRKNGGHDPYSTT